MSIARWPRKSVAHRCGAHAIVAAVLVATIVVPWHSLAAQGAPAKPPVATPADTVVVPRSNVTFQIGGRGYSVGSSDVTEQAGNVSYEYRTRNWGLTIDGSTLQYGALGRTLSGSGNSNLRFDYMLRPGDTLMVYGRTASQPGALDSMQIAAVGVAGGSLVDLQASSLGAPALFGGRASFAFPVGDLVLNLRGGLEIESRPASTQPVYFRGTTWMIGSTLYGNVGRGQLSGSVDVTSSSADSLGGKNLYPGGGASTFRLDLHLPIVNPSDSTADDWDSAIAAWFSTPFGDTRADQPNRLLPLGNSFGISGSLTFPVGDGSWGPSIEYLGTNATSSAVTGAKSVTSSSTGWATNFALTADIPASKVFEFNPEFGYTIGNASTSYGQTTSKTIVVKRRGRTVTTTNGALSSDAVRGWWLSLGISAHF